MRCEEAKHVHALSAAASLGLLHRSRVCLAPRVQSRGNIPEAIKRGLHGRFKALYIPIDNQRVTGRAEGLRSDQT